MVMVATVGVAARSQKQMDEGGCHGGGSEVRNYKQAASAARQ